MDNPILRRLLAETWSSPVFGDSFPPEVASEEAGVAATQTIQELARGFSGQLFRYIRPAVADKTDAEVRAIVARITPKTISFCPALTAGELDDPQRLLAVSLAIGLMYWADQTMDRGDMAMPSAIRQLAGQRPKVPRSLQPIVQRQRTALAGIPEQVANFARPEDVAAVLRCFDQQVLLNEVRLDALSRRYLIVSAADQPEFLSKNARAIARYMVIDAGFPSVSSSLYAVYRQHQPTLPPLDEIYATPPLTRLLQICNAVVRVADELGDWQMDAGTDPVWGIFCLNLFNQAHPALLEAFFDWAFLPASQRPGSHQAFAAFQNDQTRQTAGDIIMGCFFEHAKAAVRDLPPGIQTRYGRYITLCKRVLEIGYVNRVGDIALGSHD